MQLRRIGPLALICLALAACDVESSGEDGKGGAGGGLGGGGGAGGDGGGGAGGDGGAGGGGGGGGSVDGPCPSLNAQACAGREDCAPLNDVFGDFVECRDLNGVACSQLDEGRCDRRDDCAWDGEACGQPVPECEDHGAQAACEGAGCHWYDDACHEEAEIQPGRCDKPDEATCVAAEGCVWTPQGCREDEQLPTCDRLAEGACNARQDCRWNGRACEVDQSQLACEQLEMNACALRNDCAWNGETCMERPAGRCDTLDEGACQARADCEPIYNDGNEDCGCGGADARPAPPCEDPNNCGGDPVPPCDCGGGFLGCQPRMIDCGLVPPEACEATPGCHLEGANGGDVPGCEPPPPCDCAPGEDCVCAEPAPCDPPQGVCVNDDPANCGARGINECARDGRCRVQEREICEDGGMGADGRDGEAPDADRIIIAPPPCQVEQVCVPAGGPGLCEQIGDAGTCFNTPGCGWEQIPNCACDGGGAPFPDDCGCAPDDPNCACAQPIRPAPCDQCFACVTIGGGLCENLAPEQCGNVRGCHLEEFEDCFCNGDMPAPDGRRPAPPPDADPPEGGGAPEPCICRVELRCVGDGGNGGCEVLDQAQCGGREDCRWMAFQDGDGGGFPGGGGAGGAAGEGGGCACADGSPDCDCDAPGVPFPAPPAPVLGQCVPSWFPLQCHELDADRCEQNAECVVVDGPVPPCLPCAADQPDCPVCEPARLCVNIHEHCNGLPPDVCAADERCFPREEEICFGGGGPACPEGAECLIAPPPDEGECQVQLFCVPVQFACDQLPPDRCDDVQGCLRLEGDAGCWSADPDACWGLDLDRCEAHPACDIGQGGACGCFIDERGNEVCDQCMEVDQCMPRREGPVMCGADGDCPDGTACVNGVCGGLVGGQCDDERACPPNAVCVDGLCVLVR